MWHDDEMESQLNEALTRYSMSEPRSGLEQRVLAKLQTVACDESHAVSWWWTLAAAMACLLVVIGALQIAWRNNRGVAEQQVSTHAGVVPGNAIEAGVTQPGAISQPQPLSHRAQVITRINPSKSPGLSIGEEAPKLAQFPAPEPLSPREALLVRYVGSDPQNAELMAEAIAMATQERMADLGIPANLSAKDSDRSMR
jgi:hypothetical protein